MSHVAPMRTLNRPKPAVSVERRPDGALVLSAGRVLPVELPLVIDRLQQAAQRRPDVTFLAERRGPSRAWQRLTYAEAWARTGAVASWLIAEGFGVKGRRVHKKSELKAAIQEMLDHDGPFVLDIIVPYTEHVLPMIPAGKSVKEMILK